MSGESVAFRDELGVQQSPMEGVSMLCSFTEADALERHDQQYFEVFGNRGIYHRGWSAVTKHRTPWVVTGTQVAFDDDMWARTRGLRPPVALRPHGPADREQSAERQEQVVRRHRGDRLRREFAYDAGGLGKGGSVSLYYDGDRVGEGRVEHTLPFLFSADETADVGVDTGTPVAPDHVSPDGAFTGDIHWVRVDTGPNDADHFIRPEDRIRIAMGRQ
ncbi:hypothetical protein [Streptomyces sp. NPDC005423]|uniref:hypothetical protein n=1 Tax=Streptomyces sp. NPDC005423 TaxID=3155343 RepID=UPI0033A87999